MATNARFSAEAQRFRDPVTGRFVKFVPNYPVIDKVLTITPAMQAELLRHAESIVSEAKDIARSEAYQSGDYYRGIRASAGIDKAEGLSHNVAVARANAFDWKSHWIEWGTAKNFPARNVLTRGAEAAGYQVAGFGKNIRRIAAGGQRLWSSRLRNQA